MKVTQLCPTLCDSMGYTVHGILQARILEWVVFLFSKGSSQPRNRTQVSQIAGRFFTSWATRAVLWLPYTCIFLLLILPFLNLLICVLVTQSCLTLCDPMDCSPVGSSVHGILQARILEWVAISFSRGSSEPRDQTQVSCIVGSFFTDWATREALYW